MLGFLRATFRDSWIPEFILWLLVIKGVICLLILKKKLRTMSNSQKRKKKVTPSDLRCEDVDGGIAVARERETVDQGNEMAAAAPSLSNLPDPTAESSTTSSKRKRSRKKKNTNNDAVGAEGVSEVHDNTAKGDEISTHSSGQREKTTPNSNTKNAKTTPKKVDVDREMLERVRRKAMELEIELRENLELVNQQVSKRRTKVATDIAKLQMDRRKVECLESMCKLLDSLPVPELDTPSATPLDLFRKFAIVDWAAEKRFESVCPCFGQLKILVQRGVGETEKLRARSTIIPTYFEMEPNDPSARVLMPSFLVQEELVNFEKALAPRSAPLSKIFEPALARPANKMNSSSEQLSYSTDQSAKQTLPSTSSGTHEKPMNVAEKQEKSPSSPLSDDLPAQARPEKPNCSSKQVSFVVDQASEPILATTSSGTPEKPISDEASKQEKGTSSSLSDAQPAQARPEKTNSSSEPVCYPRPTTSSGSSGNSVNVAGQQEKSPSVPRSAHNKTKLIDFLLDRMTRDLFKWAIDKKASEWPTNLASISDTKYLWVRSKKRTYAQENVINPVSYTATMKWVSDAPDSKVGESTQTSEIELTESFHVRLPVTITREILQEMKKAREKASVSPQKVDSEPIVSSSDFPESGSEERNNDESVANPRNESAPSRSCPTEPMRLTDVKSSTSLSDRSLPSANPIEGDTLPRCAPAKLKKKPAATTLLEAVDSKPGISASPTETVSASGKRVPTTISVKKPIEEIGTAKTAPKNGLVSASILSKSKEATDKSLGTVADSKPDELSLLECKSTKDKSNVKSSTENSSEIKLSRNVSVPDVKEPIETTPSITSPKKVYSNSSTFSQTESTSAVTKVCTSSTEESPNAKKKKKLASPPTETTTASTVAKQYTVSCAQSMGERNGDSDTAKRASDEVKLEPDVSTASTVAKQCAVSCAQPMGEINVADLDAAKRASDEVKLETGVSSPNMSAAADETKSSTTSGGSLDTTKETETTTTTTTTTTSQLHALCKHHTGKDGLLYAQLRTGYIVRLMKRRLHSLAKLTNTSDSADVCNVCQEPLTNSEKKNCDTFLSCIACHVKIHPKCKVRLFEMCAPSPSALPPSHKRCALHEYVNHEFRPRIPMLVVQIVLLVTFGEKRSTKGMYRNPETDRKFNNFKKLVTQGAWRVNLRIVEPILLGEVLKHFFGSLKPRLISQDLFKKLKKCVTGAKCGAAVADELKKTLLGESEATRDTLTFLIMHLQDVNGVQELQMSADELARAFAPVLIDDFKRERNSVYRDAIKKMLQLPRPVWLYLFSEFVSAPDSA